jgi:acyl dehydratase
MASTRRLAAILAADVAGYSRLMGTDEEGTHERLKAHRRELVDPKISEHSGRIVKTTGDGMLVEFPSIVGAVRCAAEVQRAMKQRRRRPMAGLYFEEFEEGQVFEHAISRTVTEMDNVLFSTLTMNPQPLHLDEEFAKQTEFGQRLVNSLFTLGLVIGISVGETTLGTTIANLGMSDVRFPKPVFHGDTLRARTIVRSKRRSQSRKDAGIVEFEHQGINQRGETVAICRRAGLMKCRSAEG